MKLIMVFSAVVVCGFAQRPSYRPSPFGYPIMESSSTTVPSNLGNRFGDGVAVTTVKLPLEAFGDAELVDRLSKQPIDQQPFWLINWMLLEENRNNPQTYPQKGNGFIDTSSNSNVILS